MSKQSKTIISASVEQDLLEWIDSQIATKRFANRSHAIIACLYDCKCRDEKDSSE